MSVLNLRCGLLTPPGTGAIAVLRVAGAGAWELVCSRVRGRGGPLPVAWDVGRLYFGVFYAEGDALDEVIVACVDARNGEQIVDVSSHGGVRIVERLVAALTGAGAAWVEGDPAAGAGESWLESVRDAAYQRMTRATTRRGVLFLMRQAVLLPRRLADIVRTAEAGEAALAQGELGELAAQSRGAWYFHQPAEVALIGPPNAGKSLLANRLAGREGAIVTQRPGTTRDWVVLRAAIKGVPLNLIDTAGVRATADALEEVAIQAGRRRAARADLVVLVLDRTAKTDRPALGEWASAAGSVRIVVFNKVDLASGCDPGIPPCLENTARIKTSAQTGEGLGELGDAVLAELMSPQVADDADAAAVFCREWCMHFADLAGAPLRSGGELAREIRSVIRSA